MSEAALVGTTQESQEDYPLNPYSYWQGNSEPFKKPFRYKSVVGMASFGLSMAGERKDEDKEPKAFTGFFQGKVLMDSEAELYSNLSSAITKITVIPQENLGSTDEMITESASELRDKKLIENEITKLLSWGSDIEFEQGMENDFTRALEKMVLNYSVLAIDMLSDAINQRKFNEDLISEIAQYLGIIIDEATNFKRRLLLLHLLEHDSNIVRYGAIIGLELLNDSKAINGIETAIQNEDFEPLQIEMMEILDVLRGE